MILNGSAVPDGTTFDADVCVVGAGAAGLTLALDLTRRGLKVILVESGGLQFHKRSHDLLDIELSGQSTEALINGTRERFFGGTTNHWGGVCRALGAFEFEPHSWMPHSGWPITRADLEPYYTLAAQLLGLPEVERVYDAQALGVADHPRLVGESETAVESTIWRRIPVEHLRMGQWRLKEVETSQLLTCILDTSIVEIHPDRSRERISSLEGRTFDKRTLHFRARDYVLCAGAIENPRLLLASNSVVAAGLGNEHDLVGRFFMDHPATRLGLLLTNPLEERAQEDILNDSELVGWTTTPLAREQFKLQGFMAWLWPGEERPYLPHQLAMNKLVHSPSSAAETAASTMWIAVNWEQAPNPDSRVTLSDKKDIFGLRVPALHWDLLPQDLASVRKSSELLALAVARSGRGRINMDQISKPPLTMGGGHQMGTTRMSNDPKQGVTDANGRVHSLENLFIGGSSLFPTGGWEHPTFTIVTLALRQADYLAARAKSG
ncbi:MAG: GMC family oxidoreductase [Halioglobus sp.]